MPNLRLIAVNATGGAQVVVTASIPCRHFDVIEDEATTPQGLVYQSPEDNFVGTYTVGAPTEPLIVDNDISKSSGHSPVIGWPAQNTAGALNFRAADTIFKVVSVNLATKIRFRERE